MMSGARGATERAGSSNPIPIFSAVVRKNSIQLPSDRDVGTYLFGLRDLVTRDVCSAGIARVSSCFGKGSRKLVGHEFLRTSATSSCKWHKRIRLGDKRACQRSCR